jgi:transposase
LLAQRFDDPALSTTYAHYRATLQARDAALDAIEADLATRYGQPPFEAAVARLAAYRGVTRLGALTLASEVGDWRRFATAPQFMGFCGLVPSEYSSGTSTHRGRITKTGNSHLRAQLVESAWAYQYRAAATGELRRRQHGLPPETVARAGPPSCGCVAGSVAWLPASTPDRSRSLPLLGSWPGSCGPR